ncbi:hypothetical protein EXS57_02485 [Candidatus Kaiserbacteria bacterium]|nr:hypothetical protein [Candidatus Kaiserbacteria bacterium]
MQNELGVKMALTSVFLMVAVFLLADWGNMLTPGRMRAQMGFPLAVKGDWWGNLFLLSPALYIMGKYAQSLGRGEVLIAVLAAFVASYVLFELVYRKGEYPDALAGAGVITPAGWVTVFYSTVVFAAISLFYLRAPATTADILIVSGLLMLYIPIANHVLLWLLDGWCFFPWCPPLFRKEEMSPLYFILLGEVAVMVATIIKLDLWFLL